MADPATIAVGISVGAQILGGIFGNKSAKKQAKQQARLLREGAAAQRALTVKSAFEQLDEFGTRQEHEMLQRQLADRLQKAQITQRTEVAVARQRSQQQRARIAGVGGSFTRIRSGRSELEAESGRQFDVIERQTQQFGSEQRLRADEARSSFQRIASQAFQTEAATAAGVAQTSAAAQSAADINFLNTGLGAVSDLVKLPAVNEAISGFFS